MKKLNVCILLICLFFISGCKEINDSISSNFESIENSSSNVITNEDFSSITSEDNSSFMSSDSSNEDVSTETEDENTETVDVNEEEKTIEETIQNAIKQIEDKKYEENLKERGFTNITKIVFAFHGKEVKMKIVE